MGGNNFGVSGKVIVITGGSRGLGKAMSLGLAAAGAKVVIASRKLENCQQLAAQITAAGGAALAIAAHTGELAQLDNLIEQSYRHFGRVDVLINNAATNPVTAPLSELGPELFDKIMAVNLKGPWYLASRLAPRMGADGGGSIINMVSVSGLRPAAYQGFYSATKAGLEAMTRVMAQEWAGLNIRVNSIAPGSYHSDLFDLSSASLPGFEDGAKAASLMHRIADSEEIMGPVLYLASNASSYTTGSCLVADGGYLAK